jgi:magnesium transporter
MPELGWRYGYGLALVLMVGADLWIWWRLRKAGWL